MAKRLNKTYNLKQLRHKVSLLAEQANTWLKDVRKEHPEWLWDRWDSYLYESGTNKGLFRKTSSRMNVSQAEEYINLLYSFMEDIEEQEEIYEEYKKDFKESDASFLARIAQETRKQYFRYFAPSNQAANEFVDDVRSSIIARLRDKNYRMTHSNKDIYDELVEALKIAGNRSDPLKGNSTKFRDIFTVREYYYNGEKQVKRFL